MSSEEKTTYTTPVGARVKLLLLFVFKKVGGGGSGGRRSVIHLPAHSPPVGAGCRRPEPVGDPDSPSTHLIFFRTGIR